MAKGKGKCSAEALVVGSKVKALIKANKGKMAGDFIPALNCRVSCIVASAVKRAQGNKRTTVRPYDL
jgi:hypothetical protein